MSDAFMKHLEELNLDSSTLSAIKEAHLKKVILDLLNKYNWNESELNFMLVYLNHHFNFIEDLVVLTDVRKIFIRDVNGVTIIEVRFDDIMYSGELCHFIKPRINNDSDFVGGGIIYNYIISQHHGSFETLNNLKSNLIKDLVEPFIRKFKLFHGKYYVNCKDDYRGDHLFLMKLVPELTYYEFLSKETEFDYGIFLYLRNVDGTIQLEIKMT